VNVYQSARWEFHIKFYEASGAVMDIASKTVEWALLDKNQLPVLNQPGDVTITKTDPAGGLASIVVSAAKTASVPVGRYTDFSRINGEEIMSTGQIVVAKSPFGTMLAALAYAVGAPVIGTPALTSP